MTSTTTTTEICVLPYRQHQPLILIHSHGTYRNELKRTEITYSHTTPHTVYRSPALIFCFVDIFDRRLRFHATNHSNSNNSSSNMDQVFSGSNSKSIIAFDSPAAAATTSRHMVNKLFVFRTKFDTHNTFNHVVRKLHD